MVGREAEGLTLAAKQHGDAWGGEGSDAGFESLGGLVEACLGDPVHRAERGDDVGAFVAVMRGHGDEVEQMRGHFRILDVQSEGAGNTLDGDGDGHTAAADGDDEARPGRRKLVVGGDVLEQKRRRQIGLRRRRQKPHGSRHLHLLEAEGEADRLGHGLALGLHADGAIGDDPGPAVLNRAGLAPARCLEGCAAKISGMKAGHFLFDSFR